jgi:hypothetical protein
VSWELGAGKTGAEHSRVIPSTRAIKPGITPKPHAGLRSPHK